MMGLNIEVRELQLWPKLFHSRWAVFWKFKLPGEYRARFFAVFCLIADEAYIGIGWLANVGDAG